MKNLDFNGELESMKRLMNYGSQFAQLKANVSETVEYKVKGPDGKTYGIVREKQKYYIKESLDEINFNYIGGLPNKHENEYPSYNSAYRNIELKMRSLNESKNNGNVFEVLPPDTKSEYIIEATQEMRNEIDRQKEIMLRAAGIMKESASEFINKPKFKDPEGFGTATDPKKQGEPFTDNAKASLDKDLKAKATDPKKQGSPFTDNAKADEDKFDIEKTNSDITKLGTPFVEPAKDVLGNSVSVKKPTGGKIVKVTEAQLAEIKKRVNEDYSFFDDMEDIPMGKPNDYIPNTSDDTDDEYANDRAEYDELDGNKENLIHPIGAILDFIGTEDMLPTVTTDRTNRIMEPKGLEYIGQGIRVNSDKSYVLDANGEEFLVPSELLKRVDRQRPEDTEDAEETVESIGESEEPMDEGLWDTIKAAGNVGKYFGGKGIDKTKQVGQNVANKAKEFGQNVANKTSQGIDKTKQVGQNVANKAKEFGQNVANKTSQVYNQSQAQSSQAHIDKIADNLKNELINLNTRTVKSGGQPLNYNSVLTALSNKLRGQLRNTPTTESVDEGLVKEITEAVLNSFGKHPQYQKPAFSTPPAKENTPYGQKIGNSAPFTEPVKQKIGDGEIGEDADEVSKGKTPQGMPSLGQKGDKKPFDKGVQKNGDKIAKGNSVEQGETLPGKANLGKKGDQKPFVKDPKKDALNKLAEEIVKELKKKQ